MSNLAATSHNTSIVGNTSEKSHLAIRLSLLRDILNNEVLNGNLNSGNVLKISKELDLVLNEYNKVYQKKL